MTGRSRSKARTNIMTSRSRPAYPSLHMSVVPLCPTRWAVRTTALESVIDYYAVLQKEELAAYNQRKFRGWSLHGYNLDAFIERTMSVTTEPSSTETITSRVTILSCDKDIHEEKSRSSVSLDTCHIEGTPVTQPLTGREKGVRNYTSSPNYVPLACLAVILNPVLGIPALIFGYLSKKYKRLGRSGRASKYSEIALWLSVIAIATALVIIVFIVVYIFVITPNIIRSIKGFSLDNENIYSDLEVSSMPSMVTQA
ncbi:hypothetical protein Btru_030865 [Bulinus truncatus]|nr:hypothetical protein Btru_030865 [Bulinus truncatus]